MRRLLILISAAMLGIAALPGCGDDADEAAVTSTTSTTAQPVERFGAYCEVTGELDRQEAAPTLEQLQRLSDVAPPEIKPAVELVTERFAEEGENAYSDPPVIDALNNIDTWNDQNCPAAS